MSDSYPHIAGSIAATQTCIARASLTISIHNEVNSGGQRGKPHRRRAEMMQRQSADARRDGDAGGLRGSAGLRDLGNRHTQGDITQPHQRKKNSEEKTRVKNLQSGIHFKRKMKI